MIYNKESERKLVNGVTTILGFLSLLIVKMLTTPVNGSPTVSVKFFRYLRFIWRDVVFRPTVLIELGIVGAIVGISHFRKVKEDRG